jgi:hypothetical protein
MEEDGRIPVVRSNPGYCDVIVDLRKFAFFASFVFKNSLPSAAVSKKNHTFAEN